MTHDWEFNVMGVTRPDAPGKLSAYFDWLRDNANRIEGDVFEAGVFRGRSLLGTAWLLKSIGSDKTVYGFDSFSGFPPIYHDKDGFEHFETLHREGRISAAHLAAHRKLVDYRGFLKGTAIDPENISSSENFDATNKQTILDKAAYLGLDNLVLIEGSFEDTMRDDQAAAGSLNFCCGLFDCDLYESYHVALDYFWPRLSAGGFGYLDEYFSLKFPGARIACDEFFEARDETPKKLSHMSTFFERWGVTKTS